MWFGTLMGFQEESGDQVRANIEIRGDQMVSVVNQRSLTQGRLETPSLAELRAQADSHERSGGKLRVAEVVDDVQRLHRDPANAGALFQVASQFNLLEMVSPSVTPEHGVDGYERDRTQGPACAIAAGAGTIYRNYFAVVGGQIGQSAERQIDCLADVGELLGNADERLWRMQNGYALASEDGLAEISDRLESSGNAERDALRQSLRIGVQWDTEVTLGDAGHLVTQVYSSAVPVAYSTHASHLWAPFARLVLEASYEAALSAARINAANTGNRRVFLTLLGGGAFGNEDDWIFSAVERSLHLARQSELDVAIVSYGRSRPRVRELARTFS